MRLRAKRAQHVHDVIDVIVEIEAPGHHRHHARVRPIGDVDFVLRQERFHRAAQQRRVVARHRRDDQHSRIGAFAARIAERLCIALEMQHPAPRRRPDTARRHRDVHAVDRGGRQLPLGLAIAARDRLKQFRRRRGGARNVRTSDRVKRRAQHGRLHQRGHPKWRDRHVPELVKRIEQFSPFRAAPQQCAARSITNKVRRLIGRVCCTAAP